MVPVASYDCLSLKLLCRCSSCGSAIPVNFPTNNVTCTNCRAENQLPEADWKAVMSKVPPPDTLAYGTEKRFNHDKGGVRLDCTVKKDYPHCPACGGQLLPTPPGDGCRCGKCNARQPAKPAPRWFTGLRARNWGGGKLDITGIHGDDSPPPPPTKKAVSVSCNSCGAKLESNGTSRSVECSYCGTMNVLPDEVWRALHPPQAAKPWWILCHIRTDHRKIPWTAGAMAINLFTGMLAVLAVFSIFVILPIAIPWLIAIERLELLVYGYLALVALLAVIAGGSNLRRVGVVKPENELVARLGKFERERIEVELLDPADLSRVVDRSHITIRGSLAREHYQKLGGRGGLLRAWRSPKSGRVFVQKTPTGLVLAGTTVTAARA